MSNEQQKMCTTSGRPVEEVRADQTAETGQYKDYIVLCPDERAKGFVRPFRNKYIHTGRSLKEWASIDRMLSDEEKLEHPNKPYVAVMTQIVGDMKAGTYVTQEELDAWKNGERFGGCGVETVMGNALSETYARDPSFYGATFCVGCNRHLPVAEFVWSQDGEQVGS